MTNILCFLTEMFLRMSAILTQTSEMLFPTYPLRLEPACHKACFACHKPRLPAPYSDKRLQINKRYSFLALLFSLMPKISSLGQRQKDNAHIDDGVGRCLYIYYRSEGRKLTRCNQIKQRFLQKKEKYYRKCLYD